MRNKDKIKIDHNLNVLLLIGASTCSFQRGPPQPYIWSCPHFQGRREIQEINRKEVSIFDREDEGTRVPPKRHKASVTFYQISRRHIPKEITSYDVGDLEIKFIVFKR